MAIIERDVALQGTDPVTGRPTIDLPFTRAGNIENSAERITSASENDVIPIFTPDGVYMKTIAVRDLFSGRGSIGTSVDIRSESIVISKNDWSTETLESYNYYINVPVEGIGTNHNPNVVLDVTAHTIASKAGVCSTVESFDGYIRFRSRDIPESDITGVCTFINTSSEGENENVTQYALRIPETGWSNDGQNSEYPLALTLNMEGISGSQQPTAILDVASQSEAKNCGLCPTVETLDGGLKLRTKTAPTKALSGVCYLVG